MPETAKLAANRTLKAKINEVKSEATSITNLATTTAFNAKINEVKGKISSIFILVTNTALTAFENKIPDHSKYITTIKFNKLRIEDFTARLKKANLTTKGDIADFLKNADFDDKLKSLNKNVTLYKTKDVLVKKWINEISQKVKLLSIKDYSFLQARMYFTSDNGLQNMFVYQPIFNSLKYKSTNTEYVISWKPRRVYNSKLMRLNSNLSPNIEYFENKIGIQFNNTPLVVEKNNYTTKIVNVYIVYDLDNWPKSPLRNFTIKNCLFGATISVKHNDKEKYGYSGCGIAFDGKGYWNFNDDYARNAIIFGVDNSSSSCTDNLKNHFLILGLGDTFGIHGSFGAP